MSGSALGLLCLGAAIGWLNGMNVPIAATRQLVFGMAAAAIPDAPGALVGTVLLA